MESIGVAYLEGHMLSWDRLTIGAHWSPLELENIIIGMAVITIGAHWSPLELLVWTMSTEGENISDILYVQNHVIISFICD